MEHIFNGINIKSILINSLYKNYILKYYYKLKCRFRKISIYYLYPYSFPNYASMSKQKDPCDRNCCLH